MRVTGLTDAQFRISIGVGTDGLVFGANCFWILRDGVPRLCTACSTKDMRISVPQPDALVIPSRVTIDLLQCGGGGKKMRTNNEQSGTVYTTT